ncbi:MAG: hypothetical protein KDA37_15220 [Planctomycetales bacterium]|nr:hypothetical protein [Planctomycetales bacterium]
MLEVRVWSSRIVAAVALVLLAVVLIQLVSVLGAPPPRKRGDWHRKYAWRAERYFPGQPQVIELCYAIEANDLEEIDRLVAAGADVNAKGVSNMTPLMWAYPDGNLRRFKRLLERGANPNVIVQSELNTNGKIKNGEFVTHLAVLNPDIEYFKAVFNGGGDPNLLTKRPDELDEKPLFQLIRWGGADKKERLRILIARGADLEGRDYAGTTPAMQAESWGGQYDIALLILESGADPFAYQDDWIMKLAHVVLREKTRPKSPEQAKSFAELYRWMEAKGVDFSEAQADRDRWRSSTAYSIQAKNRELQQEARRNRAAAARSRAKKQGLDVQEPAAH